MAQQPKVIAVTLCPSCQAVNEIMNFTHHLFMIDSLVSSHAFATKCRKCGLLYNVNVSIRCEVKENETV